MLRLVIVAIAIAGVAGCRSVTVESYGADIARGADGLPLLNAAGEIQRIDRGWVVSYWQHWMTTDVDALNAYIKPGDISFGLGNLSTRPSEELNKLVDTSLKGAALLASRVGAAIATAGGSVAGETACAAVRDVVARYVGKGGDPASAQIDCSGGQCTISDGKISESCCIVP